ncbi:Crp/Fnr family transcriptional regulator [Taibaiella soli]|uniref:Crp/Fnr family transcriptional regulator n=1 Tax=Taibaiella soli TaxID=1649169 RepID=A0A2W2AAK3_9BACT|nr:Crp/Fnr family transcriptional regulator [Taibaiella soli]PZF72311.1 Crp/Fnr family transcriptional regulator [Taibaiella soli]
MRQTSNNFTPVTQPLLSHIQKFTSIPPDKISLLEPFFEHKTYKKKEVLLAEGQRCFEKFFIVKGCVHLSYLRQNGTEQTVDFAMENWWTSDFSAFPTAAVSKFSIRATEHTEVLIITADRQHELLQQVPELNEYFHLVFQRAYAACQMRFRFLFEFSKEELYQNFLQNFPAFVQRVPQYLLASFLGFTPEYLSEIRKKYLS